MPPSDINRPPTRTIGLHRHLCNHGVTATPASFQGLANQQPALPLIWPFATRRNCRLAFRFTSDQVRGFVLSRAIAREISILTSYSSWRLGLKSAAAILRHLGGVESAMFYGFDPLTPMYAGDWAMCRVATSLMPLLFARDHLLPAAQHPPIRETTGMQTRAPRSRLQISLRDPLHYSGAALCGFFGDRK